MALIIKEIKLEVSKPNLIQAIVAKQNDCNSRFLKVSLWDEGVQIPIRPNSQVTINAERKDGKSDSFFGEVNDDNTVTVPLHSWMLELDGTVNCDVSIFVDERKLTTTTFVVSVEKASNNSDDISTDPQYDVLINLIEEVSELKENLATVDQEYNANSENAQSGKAVAQAIANAGGGGGGGGGAVASVNGKTGAVVLSATDVGALPSTTKIPSKVSDLTNDSGYLTSIPSEYVTETELNAKKYLTSYTETDPTVPSWAKASTKPSYSKSEVGLGNVDNVKQYSASNPPPYPVTKVNGKTGDVTLTASDVGIDVIPDYVKTEAESVIDRVIAVQGNRTFTFAAITDLHYGSWGYYEGITDYADGIKHACQALKYIDERIKLDAVAVLGDYTDGMAHNQYETAIHDFKGVNGVLDKLRFAPNLRLQGNHDFVAEKSPIAYRYIGAYSDGAVEWGNPLGGYFYKDFSVQKLRVICLNTSETGNGGVYCSDDQYNWFVRSLDLSAKEKADEWQTLILSHVPIDMWTEGGKYRFVYLLDAYKKGTTWTDGTISCDFSNGKNKAKLVGNIHGHVHNFKMDKLYLGNIEESTSTQTDVWRMATPNACFGLENKDYTGFKEDTTYTKTANSADDTAFCVYCVDLDTCTIKAICYGAGYDRELVYAATYTDVLATSTDANGNVYNGKGWKENTRWSGSSQAEKEYEGLYLSGYISIEHLTGNATGYMKDVNFIAGGAGKNSIVYYVNKGTYEYEQEHGSITDGVYDDNGVLKQFTIHGGYYKYFRVTSCGFSDDSIITINQPIE